MFTKYIINGFGLQNKALYRDQHFIYEDLNFQPYNNSIFAKQIDEVKVASKEAANLNMEEKLPSLSGIYDANGEDPEKQLASEVSKNAIPNKIDQSLTVHTFFKAKQGDFSKIYIPDNCQYNLSYSME